jgi:putative heme iron utilization protein
MNESNEQAVAARQLLAGAFFGVLSTHSREHAGYPFGSVTPYALDYDGYPTLLLSHLSQHTKNLEANAKCSLTVIEQGQGDIQQRPRLTAIGAVEPQDSGAIAARFFRFYPQSEMYFKQLGFRFYRYRPIRFHWNAGFATARWFSENRIIGANPLNADQESRIVQHMNKDHANALLDFLRDAGRLASGAAAIAMVGIDAQGIDLRQGDRLTRIPLHRRIANPAEARAVLEEMTQLAPD